MTTDTSTETVTALLDGVTGGKWVQFHPAYCAAAAGAKIHQWDTSHDLSAVFPDGKRRKIGTFTHAHDAGFAQLARDLVPALLAERDALAADVARLTAQLDAARDRALDEALEILEWRRPKKEDRSLVAAKVAFVAACNEIRALKDAAP